MATAIWTILCTLIFALAFRYLQRQYKYRRLVNQYGCQSPCTVPLTFPYTGAHVIEGYMSGIGSNKWMLNLLNNPGKTTTARVWGQNWLYTAHAENVREILTHQASSMSVELSRKPQDTALMGDGMFISDGERWRTSRSLFKTMFSRSQISDLHAFEVHLERFLSALPPDGMNVDLQERLKKLYLDDATELLFGRSFESQLEQEGKKPRVDVEQFQKEWGLALIGMHGKLWFGWLSYFLGSRAKWAEHCRYVHSVIDGCINETLEASQSRESRTSREQRRISMVEELAEYSSDRRFLRDQLLNIFIGANDTAAIGISNIFFHLARHPHVWRRLRDEVSSPGEQSWSFESLKAMKYLQAVVAESLRLQSPVGAAIRHTTKDVVLPRGGGPDGHSPILVTRGTRIEINIPTLHRNRSFWGEDAEMFKPERWLDRLNLDERVKNDASRAKWEYVPFLGGARICPAQQMILTQYALILVRFCQRVKDIENRDPNEEYVGKVVFARESKDGVNIALHRW